MDKQTLTTYGWLVVTVIIIAMLTFYATPIGEHFGDGFENTAKNTRKFIESLGWDNGKEIEFERWKESEIADDIPDKFKNTGEKLIAVSGNLSDSENCFIKGLNGEANNKNYNTKVVCNIDQNYRLSALAQKQISNLLSISEINDNDIQNIYINVNTICSYLSECNISSISQITNNEKRNENIVLLKQSFEIAGCSDFEYQDDWVRFKDCHDDEYCFKIAMSESFN